VRQHHPTLSEDQVDELEEIGLNIQNLFGYPLEIEQAYEKRELFDLAPHKNL
jgi:phosphoenolpyruvate synthase/pyruvate phosphate dikinase